MLCTCEQVSCGHPDKICDQIADAIVTDCLKHDPDSRVAVECMIKDFEIIVAGEITSRHKRCENRGEVDCWYITNNHPAIISPEKFDRVQYILEERWDKLNTPKEPFNGELGNSHNRYPLSGKLFCPYCGALLIHKWGKHRTREYWACSTNLKKSKAACKGIFLPASETVGWDIDEPVVALSYKDDFGRKRYTAFPFDEYEMMKTEGMNT